MNKKEKFFKLLLGDLIKRKGVDFVLLFCRYDLKMTDKELKGLFSDEDIKKNKRFNYKSYKEAIKLAGNIFSRGITIWFGRKKYSY